MHWSHDSLLIYHTIRGINHIRVEIRQFMDIQSTKMLSAWDIISVSILEFAVFLPVTLTV
ncbi:hypothetical protein APHMUC_0188 [Anaplasma phagocytophilum str. ApMUC09]|uniref:Uncharacterized protein n=1 Tax=Anaplasma phagocytophilum str. ApMUC09 TaxID=1359152 RepID=A0A0F3NDN2_ANAPH|nr:hypothetical protein APHMUC_0188 [Anaplasma phagocytophilum str. ApMUC09]